MMTKTAFITRCYRSSRPALAARLFNACLNSGRVFLPWLILLSSLLIVCRQVYAEGAAVTSAKLEVGEEGYQLTADFDIQFTAAQQEAIRKGVPLYFVIEFELSRARWYWLDEKLVRQSRDRRVSYAPLTDQYRITVSGISQNVSRFEDVKRFLSSVRSWNVVDRNRLKPGEPYEAAIRVRLDTSQLPKPFQLNVIASREWDLSSDWYRWKFVPSEVKP